MIGYQHPDVQWVIRLQSAVDKLSKKLDMLRLMEQRGILSPDEATERIDKARRVARVEAGFPPDPLPGA